MSSPWETEFDPSYDVPEAIIAALPDISWHNDACPCFGHIRPEGKLSAVASEVRLWVEHPDPERRESGGKRYLVATSNQRHRITDRVLYRGDDVEAALRAVRRMSK